MKKGIIIVSIGSGDPELLNAKTIQYLSAQDSVLYLRTGRHALASWLQEQQIPFETMDRFYETAGDFDDMNRMIAGELMLQAAGKKIVFAVSDAGSDKSVLALLREKPEDLSVEIIPGVGLYDLAVPYILSAQGQCGIRIVSAYDLLACENYDPNQNLLITEVDDPILAGQVKLMLSEKQEDEYPVLVLRNHTECDGVPLYMLDRQKQYDQKTAVFIPGSGYTARGHFVLNDLLRIMETLRAPDGCPWDSAQTHQSLRRYMIEEAWESVSAIDQQNYDHLAEELGDLLFQIVFHSSIGKAYDEFSMNDVIDSICRKMLHRHPHVFQRETGHSDGITFAEWDELKRAENGGKSVIESLTDIASSLPSLIYAEKLLKKLSQFPAFQRSREDILSEIRRVASSLAASSEAEKQMEKLLLLCAELCGVMNLDGEILLHRTVNQIRDRLQAAEKKLLQEGRKAESLTVEELHIF